MESITLSLSGRLWLEQIRRSTPGPFARLRNQLDRVLETRSRIAATPKHAIETSLLLAFDAACRDDPLAAEDALARLIGHRPPDALLSDLLASCVPLKQMTGWLCFERCLQGRAARQLDHARGRKLDRIH